MEKNIDKTGSQAIDQKTSGSGTASSRKYRGDMTSKEAGNMVRDMIREQEKAMLAADQSTDIK